MTRTNPITKEIESFDVRHFSYEAVEFAHDELKEAANQLRFAAECLPDGIPAQKQNRINAEMLERRAANLLYEHCNHEFEGRAQPGTPHNPPEYFVNCKHCGAEPRESD